LPKTISYKFGIPHAFGQRVSDSRAKMPDGCMYWADCMGWRLETWWLLTERRLWCAASGQILTQKDITMGHTNHANFSSLTDATK